VNISAPYESHSQCSTSCVLCIVGDIIEENVKFLSVFVDHTISFLSPIWLNLHPATSSISVLKSVFLKSNGMYIMLVWVYMKGKVKFVFSCHSFYCMCSFVPILRPLYIILDRYLNSNFGIARVLHTPKVSIQNTSLLTTVSLRIRNGCEYPFPLSQHSQPI
jgi:hypothetical protein